MKQISVVMPYSGSSTLPYALQSLKTQTLGEACFELILVGQSDARFDEKAFRDDCRFEINYQRCRLKKGFAGHSAGPLRNLGVRHARSEIIVFMDSDCLLAPSCLLFHKNLHTRQS